MTLGQQILVKSLVLAVITIAIAEKQQGQKQDDRRLNIEVIAPDAANKVSPSITESANDHSNKNVKNPYKQVKRSPMAWRWRQRDNFKPTEYIMNKAAASASKSKSPMTILRMIANPDLQKRLNSGNYFMVDAPFFPPTLRQLNQGASIAQELESELPSLELPSGEQITKPEDLKDNTYVNNETGSRRVKRSLTRSSIKVLKHMLSKLEKSQPGQKKRNGIMPMLHMFPAVKSRYVARSRNAQVNPPLLHMGVRVGKRGQNDDTWLYGDTDYQYPTDYDRQAAYYDSKDELEDLSNLVDMEDLQISTSNRQNLYDFNNYR